MTGKTEEDIDARRYRFLRDHPEIQIEWSADTERWFVYRHEVQFKASAMILDRGGYGSHELAVDAAIMAEGR